MINMNEDFARVFRIDGLGQVVAILLGADETESPEIRFFSKPEGEGVGYISLIRNEDETWSNFQNTFYSMDNKKVAEIVKHLVYA